MLSQKDKYLTITQQSLQALINSYNLVENRIEYSKFIRAIQNIQHIYHQFNKNHSYYEKYD